MSDDDWPYQRLMEGAGMADTKKAEDTSDLAAEVRDLRNALTAMRATLPTSLLPEHGGGPGGEVAETWSLADQEAARAEG